ncbi:thiol:disulfide interchange protein TlpA [Kordia sp. SMS9]|uniref:TlpA family protein disulfide reductase n=1 Tax=Kordia sp. SMS9 TaxID=2282170 RepID=UPI000E103740|nr:TlpA disulfide reductase family protein [Kordia sp. SMS9]AXG72281.1 thiol:disulfide interchange protein TlpA [Kordia sp. SMS9]
MKYILYVCLIAFLGVSCQKQILKEFPPEALQEMMLSVNGETHTFENILKKHQGKTIFVDIWASWCRDCLVGIPDVKEIQKNNPQLTYLFLSLDRNKAQWKASMKKYDLTGTHYYVKSGMKGSFGKAIGLNWIPRYMIVNPNGSIKLFEAIKTDDKVLLKALQ